jgi:membrane protein implicated in regulation of membrane protease activity
MNRITWWLKRRRVEGDKTIVLYYIASFVTGIVSAFDGIYAKGLTFVIIMVIFSGAILAVTGDFIGAGVVSLCVVIGYGFGVLLVLFPKSTILVVVLVNLLVRHWRGESERVKKERALRLL